MHHDHYASVRLFELTRKYKINNAIETGTYQGKGALWLLKFVNNVTTIEYDIEYFIQSQVRFRLNGFIPQTYGYVDNGLFISYVKPETKLRLLSYLGSSPNILDFIFKNSPKSVRRCKYIVYLDAHWGDQWPILDEIRTLKKYNLKKALIMIHDFKVPGKKWGYDSFKGKPLDLKHVKKDLMKLNPDFKLEYNKKSLEGKDGRGILYAIPMNLEKKNENH